MYTLRRWGEFECAIKPGTPHCGPDDKILRTFRYEIVCQASDDALDEHGFLIDNMTVSSYVTTTYGNPDNPVTESCERLAQHIADGIKGLIPVLSSCETLDVTIYPFEGASITYHWVNPISTIPTVPVTDFEVREGEHGAVSAFYGD
jgi:hypothetical protein